MLALIVIYSLDSWHARMQPSQHDKSSDVASGSLPLAVISLWSAIYSVLMKLFTHKRQKRARESDPWHP